MENQNVYPEDKPYEIEEENNDFTEIDNNNDVQEIRDSASEEAVEIEGLVESIISDVKKAPRMSCDLTRSEGSAGEFTVFEYGPDYCWFIKWVSYI